MKSPAILPDMGYCGTSLAMFPVVWIWMDGDVGVDDLSNFAQEWLSDDLQTPANVDRVGRVNLEDFALVSEYWLFSF